MEQLLFNKTIKIGRDLTYNSPVYLTLKIENIKKAKTTINHKIVYSYKTLSLTGKSINMGGQIREDLTTDNFIFSIPFETVERIKDIWAEYHLNDMSPNCEHQGVYNASDYVTVEAAETAKCPHGYKYGSAWLLKEIPEDILNEIIDIFNKR